MFYKVYLLKSLLMAAGFLASIECSFASGLSDLAKQGQQSAYAIFEATPPERLDATKLPEVAFRERVVAFYREHYQDLLDEAAQSEIEFRTKNDNGACGETTKERHSKIYLSRVDCVGRIDSTGAMARLLIGEYVHHLGQGDEFTDWVKQTVVASFADQNTDEFKELFLPKDPYGFDRDTKLQDVVGNVYFNSDTSDPQMFAIDLRGRVLLPAPKKLSDTVELINITRKPVQWDDQKKAFVTVGEWVITGHESRYWGQGLYEKYPVFFRRALYVEVRYLQNAEAVLVTFDKPVRVDLAKQDVVMQRVTMSLVRKPEKSVIEAFFKRNRVEEAERKKRSGVIP